MSLNPNNFVQVSVSPTQAGLPGYSPNNLCILTKDAPLQNYGKGATATATIAAGAVTAIAVNTGGTGFGANPPVLITGGGGTGALATATVVSGVVTAITIVNGGTGYTGVPTITIGNSYQTYRDAPSVGADFGLNSETYAQAVNVFSQNPNPLVGNGVGLIVYAMNSGDTLTTAINAVLPQIFCGGFMAAGYTPNASEYEAGAATVQALFPPPLLGVPTSNLADIYPGGLCATIQAASQQQARLLLYTLANGNWTPAQSARLAMAAYLARLMSTDFSGSNTTSTMNLKQLVNVLPDTGITQTVLNQCAVVGADTYGLYATLSETYSTGANGFSDNVYNMGWFIGALMTGLFNALATTNTKIPQTEAGMTFLKNAVIQVCEQAVANGFIAPGTYTGTMIGNPADCARNILNTGFYVYSASIANQSQTQRAQRIAPLIQLAVKFAGAIQFISLSIYPQP